jgi:hypothetical protein
LVADANLSFMDFKTVDKVIFDWGLQGGYIMTGRLLAGKDALKLNGCVCFSAQSPQRYCTIVPR